MLGGKRFFGVRGFLSYLLVFTVFSSRPVFANESSNCSAALRSLLDTVTRDTQTPKRKLGDITELKLGTYNTLNLMQDADTSAAGMSHREDIAEVILQNDLDVVTLQEVSGLDQLQKFADTHLLGRYMPFITAGNDERGIQVGFLVKKDLPFQMKLQTHADVRAVYPVTGEERRIFSRDVPTLSIWSDAQDPATDNPLVIFNGTHFKSKRDADGDPESRILRATQAKAAAEILKKQKEENPRSLILLAGDFNGDIRSEAEFQPLRDSMRDVLEIYGVKDEDRITHSFHPRGGTASYSQLDAFFMFGDHARYILDAWVHRYKDARGLEKEIPRTFKQRRDNPSDHFPLLLKLQFQDLLNDATAALPLDRAA
jgi:endonuclease/exonuclease/phosphatase family metal-dependent hydrolase